MKTTRALAIVRVSTAEQAQEERYSPTSASTSRKSAAKEVLTSCISVNLFSPELKFYPPAPKSGLKSSSISVTMALMQ